MNRLFLFSHLVRKSLLLNDYCEALSHVLLFKIVSLYPMTRKQLQEQEGTNYRALQLPL